MKIKFGLNAPDMDVEKIVLIKKTQRKISKPALKLRMLGRAGKCVAGKASNNDVRSCTWDLPKEVAAK